MPEILPAYYYLNNFLFLLDWVNQHHQDLLSDDEKVFIQRFGQLNRDSQCLLVRMIGRKGLYFRANKLGYAEIEDQHQALQSLTAAGLIEQNAILSLPELASLLTKAELVVLFKDNLHHCKQQPREILLQTLSEQFAGQRPWSEWTNKQLDELYHLKVQTIADTLMLIFFGNAYQDLTEFVLQDLGLYRYEKYTIDRQHRVFKTRQEITQYLQLVTLRQQISEATDVHGLESLLAHLPPGFASSSMERRRARVFNQLAYEFERYQQTHIALQLYQQVDSPPARERRIRLLEKHQDFAQAWQLLTALMLDPANEHELQIAERMAPRLARKSGIPYAKKAPHKPVEQRLVLERISDENGEFFTVEEIARRHFNTDESPCIYAENRLFNALLGLWLWPEMFRSIDGAFANPFQSAPLDFYDQAFEKNRPEMKHLWQLLDDQQHHEHIRQMWKDKTGIANHLVNWQFIDEEIINIALTCIPTRDLKLIFRRLLFDLKANRSGLPDLIQFFPDRHCYRLIEVKGPGDRIQDNQQRWLNFFAEHSIPAEVCYVSWRQN